MYWLQIWKDTMADRDQSHLDATRAQVNEVQNIMKNNVDKIMEREGKLSDLEGRADQLQASLKKYLYIYTECPIDMLTTSDSILQFL